MSTIDPRRESSERAAPSTSRSKHATQATLPGFREAREARAARVGRASGAAAGPNPRALLLGSPRTVLARITCGDPLDLGRLVAGRLRARHLLMDAERVQLGALVRCAREGARYRGKPGFERWLAERVERAIDAELDAPRGERPVAALWSDLARPLGLSPEGMAQASSNFNALPAEARAAFFQLVLGGRSLDELAGSTGRAATQLARDARRALQVFLDAAEPRPSSPARSRS